MGRKILFLLSNLNYFSSAKYLFVPIDYAYQMFKDIIPTKKVLKKIYVIRKMSDGTMMKKEIPPEDPRYQ